MWSQSKSLDLIWSDRNCAFLASCLRVLSNLAELYFSFNCCVIIFRYIYFSAKRSSNSGCPTRKLSWMQAGIREAEVKWDLISDQSHKWPLSGNQWHALAAFFFQKTHVSVVLDSKWENILPFIWQFSLPWLPRYLKLSHKFLPRGMHARLVSVNQYPVKWLWTDQRL